MTKIDISEWKDFKLGYLIDDKTGEKTGTGLFAIINSTAYHGKDIEETDFENPDGLNYVTRSKFNNGLKCKVLHKDTYTINPSGTISFGAENADFFYQDTPYITGNKMYYIDTSSLSEFACKFLKSVLEATFTANYSFSDGMIPKRIYDENIKLPMDNVGNPDWNYMEKYMKNIEVRVCDKILKLESSKDVERHNIDVSEWGKYKIGKLFKAYLSKDDIQPKNIIEGTIPLISSGKENNGIVAYIKDDNAQLWEANTITVDMFGKAFYQSVPYHCVSHGRVNILKSINPISEYPMRFIALAIECVSSQKYEFNEMCTGKKLLEDEIYLPTKDGEPDYDYMETYMRNIENEIKSKLNILI